MSGAAELAYAARVDFALVLTVGTASLAGLWSLILVGGRLSSKTRSVRLPRGLTGTAAVLTLLRAAPAGGTVPPPAVRLAQEPADPDQPEDPVSDPNTPLAVVPEPQPGASYQVRPGDSLWAIAHNALAVRQGRRPSNCDVDRYWRTIYAANRSVVGADPDLIHPGQVFALPQVTNDC